MERDGTPSLLSASAGCWMAPTTSTELHFMYGTQVALDQWLLEGIVRGVLDRAGVAGWTVEPGDFWCVVRSPEQVRRKSGWKLHVSSTVLAGPVVLARVAEVLVREGCTFKFARDLERL